MSIQKIETIVTSPGRNYVIVKITTEDGICGYGDATLNGRELSVKSIIDTYLADLLCGNEEDNIDYIWQMVYRGTYWRGGPVLMTALSGIDMALWDIKGKKSGLPLFSLVGGKSRDKALVYYHVHGRDSADLIRRSQMKMEKGCKALRFSFDSEDPQNDGVLLQQPHQDVEISRIEKHTPSEICTLWDSGIYLNDLLAITSDLRSELGKNVELIHDVHTRLTPAQTLRAAKELQQYNLFFLEDPIDHMDIATLEMIKQQSYTPIAVGELCTNMYETCELVHRRLVDFVRVDVSHFGGITALVKLAHYAELSNVKTAFHGPSDISPIAHAALAHLALALPNFGIQESVEDFGPINEVFSSPISIGNGYLTVSSEPGLGISVEETQAQKYPYKKAYLPMLKDRMGAIHNW